MDLKMNFLEGVATRQFLSQVQNLPSVIKIGMSII